MFMKTGIDFWTENAEVYPLNKLRGESLRSEAEKTF